MGAQSLRVADSSAFEILSRKVPIDQLVAKGIEKTIALVSVIDVVGVFPAHSGQGGHSNRSWRTVIGA